MPPPEKYKSRSDHSAEEELAFQRHGTRAINPAWKAARAEVLKRAGFPADSDELPEPADRTVADWVEAKQR